MKQKSPRQSTFRTALVDIGVFYFFWVGYEWWLVPFIAAKSTRKTFIKGVGARITLFSTGFSAITQAFKMK